MNANTKAQSERELSAEILKTIKEGRTQVASGMGKSLKELELEIV